MSTDRRMRQDLDRYITGNYGEDQLTNEDVIIAEGFNGTEFILVDESTSEHASDGRIVVHPVSGAEYRLVAGEHVPPDSELSFGLVRVQPLADEEAPFQLRRPWIFGLKWIPYTRA